MGGERGFSLPGMPGFNPVRETGWPLQGKVRTERIKKQRNLGGGLMPTKAERATVLPDGLVPLLSQQQLETYYGVSDWTVLRWIKAGMPVEPMNTGGGQRKRRRFDLAKVKAWMATVS